MKKVLIWTGSVIGAAAFLTLVFDFIKTPSENRTISVTGECLTTAPKDRTAITLRVRTLDKSAAVSMKMATDKVNNITEYLKAQNLKMQTVQFDSFEKTEWDQNTQRSIVMGIETNIAIEVSSDKIENIESVLNKFAGTENVYSENLRMFTSTETMKPILEKCLGTALENARSRADAIALGDKRTAGKLIAAEYSESIGYERPMANFMRAGKMAALAPAIQMDSGLVAKDTELTVKVSAVFEVK